MQCFILIFGHFGCHGIRNYIILHDIAPLHVERKNRSCPILKIKDTWPDLEWPNLNLQRKYLRTHQLNFYRCCWPQVQQLKLLPSVAK